MIKTIIKDDLPDSNSVSKRLNKFVFSTFSFILSIPDFFFYGLLFISFIVLEYFTFHIGTDLSMQLHTLKNFVNGHGITITSIDENNQVVYLPCSLWPAGLIVLLSPIYFITKNALLSEVILKQVANIFFLIFLSKYFNYLKLESYKRKFIILFFVVSVAPFVEFFASDLVATVICLWGFYYCLLYLDNQKFKYVFFSILLLGLCYFVKYSFLPFLFFPAAAFLLKLRVAIYKYLKQFIFIIFIIVVTALLFYFLNKLLVGTAQMESSFDALKGNPHWSQLTHFDGFLFTFSVFEWVIENLLKNHFGIHLHFNCISILVTFYFYFLFIKIYFWQKKDSLNSSFKNSLNISISAGALISCFLIFLTLNNPGQTWTKPYWTFVQETRYYGPVIIIGLINILIIVLTNRKGSLVHILIPLMIVLNLFAFRTLGQSGYWGRNYQYYAKIKSNTVQKIQRNDQENIPIIYFDSSTKKSDEYTYLQSQAVILLDKGRYEDVNRIHKTDNYFLVSDSASVNLIRKN